jgi:hypothetical protein
VVTFDIKLATASLTYDPTHIIVLPTVEFMTSARPHIIRIATVNTDFSVFFSPDAAAACNRFQSRISCTDFTFSLSVVVVGVVGRRQI